jgi:threonine/homoserine efflux transporter RhtA
MSSTTRDSIRPAEAVAGFLAACGLFLGCLELFYRPFRLVPLAVILLVIATVMSRDQQRLVRIGFAVTGICFVAGAALQVITHHPLY